MSPHIELWCLCNLPRWFTCQFTLQTQMIHPLWFLWIDSFNLIPRLPSATFCFSLSNSLQGMSEDLEFKWYREPHNWNSHHAEIASASSSSKSIWKFKYLTSWHWNFQVKFQSNDKKKHWVTHLVHQIIVGKNQPLILKFEICQSETQCLEIYAIQNHFQVDFKPCNLIVI